MVVAWGLLGGCGPAVATDEGTGEADSSGDATGTATTAGTTVGTTVGTTDPTTTTVGTTATTEPAGCAGEWVGGCQSYCAALITCHPDLGTYEDCVNGCIDGFGALTPDCQVAWCEAYTCMGGLDCASFDNGNPDCDALGSAAEAMCGTATTTDTTVGDEDNGCYVGGNELECEYGCALEDHRFHCDQMACTCYVGDVETGGCAAAGACDNWDKLAGYAADCCGW